MHGPKLAFRPTRRAVALGYIHILLYHVSLRRQHKVDGQLVAQLKTQYG
jgi:hypothetical protein